MQVSTSVWLLTIAGIVALLAYDFFFHVRKPHIPTLREAAVWSAAYVGIAILFGVGVWVFGGSQMGMEYFAGYVTEKALSVDNLFVFLIIMNSFAVPRENQQKVLLFGIVFALITRTAFIFADGAGAVLLGAGDEPGFLAGRRLARGDFHDALGIYTGGAAAPVTPADENEGKPRVQFVRKFPATFNAENWPPLIESTAAKAGLTLDEIDFYLFTQLNLNTIKMIMEIIGQPLHKTHWVMDKWGYTGSACIPMALDDALERNVGPKPGDNVLFIASGGGIAMACTVWRWTSDIDHSATL